MMNKNNDSKLALLTSVVLGSLVLFLIFLCHKLILCIARVFVYLTGLATVLLVTVFYIFIIIFQGLGNTTVNIIKIKSIGEMILLISKLLIL